MSGMVRKKMSTQVTESIGSDDSSSADLASAVVEELSSGIVVVFSDGRLFLNHAAEVITGYSRSDLATLDDWFRLLHGEAGQKLRAEYEDQWSKSVESVRVTPITRKDGIVRHLEIVVANGKEGRAVWSVHDVSDRVASRERFRFVFDEGRRIEARLRRTAEALCEAQKLSLVGSFEIDFVQNRRDWSAQAAVNFGLPEHVMMSTVEWLSFVAPEDAARVTQEWNIALKGEREFNSEFRILRGDGREAVLMGRGRSYVDGDGLPVRLVGTFQDITDSRRLSDLIRNREAKLLRSAERAMVRDVFVDVSQDLSEALLAVASGVDRLADLSNRNSLYNRKDQDRLSEIENEAQGIRSAIAQVRSLILTVGAMAIERDATFFASDSLDRVIHETAQLCARRFRHHQVHLHLPTPQPGGRAIECRAADISQILFSLLINSFEAVEGIHGAEIAVSVEDSQGFWEISIVDNGTGISPSSVARIFEPFYTEKVAQGGLGLGLNIAMSLARAHGGTLRYAGGAPTRFVLRLPKRQKATGTAQAA
jgi:PAS domain S-box-containing protein